MSEPVVLCAVGDVVVDRSDPSTAFAGVQDIFGGADVCFGNNEAAYSDTQERHPAATAWFIPEPRNFVAVRDARFDAMSWVNNHIMDGRYSGFSDTLGLLRDAGIMPVGVGADFGEDSQNSQAPQTSWTS